MTINFIVNQMNIIIIQIQENVLPNVELVILNLILNVIEPIVRQIHIKFQLMLINVKVILIIVI